MKRILIRFEEFRFCCFILVTIIFCVFSFCCSCSLKQGDMKNTFLSCKRVGETIIVDVDTFSTYNYCLNVGSEFVDSGIIKGHKEFVLSKIIKDASWCREEIALDAAKNNFMHKISFKIKDVIDTTFNYQQSITKRIDDKITFSGFGAPLIKKEKIKKYENELRIWLYRRQEHLEDSLFEKFKAIYSELSLSNENEYIPVGSIPVVHDIDGYKYKINCDVKADYYAVVACFEQSYIDKFIEKLVGDNFSGVSTSLDAPLVCNYKKKSTGYNVVFLLCINKDWSYKQIPIATFALDNSAPWSTLFCDFPRWHDGSKGVFFGVGDGDISLTFNDRIRVNYPRNSPRIYGDASVGVVNWTGNGLECNVNFVIKYSGDVKSVVIQRRGELCYPDRYLGNHFRPEDKVIYTNGREKSFTFTYKMHFEDGYNTIPVIIEDYHGNKFKGRIVVYASFGRSNDHSNSIKIDNNIKIYNN